MVAHRRHRESRKGLAGHRRRNKTYRLKGYDKKDKAKWLKYNTVNRDTLKEQLFEQCEICNENTDGQGSLTCSIAHGLEDISLCPVYQEWKHYGHHPLIRIEDYDNW